MTNSLGDRVYAYHPYSKFLSSEMQAFRDVDMIRLTMQVMSEHLRLEEMQRQGVILRYFPAAKYDKVMELNKTWASLKCILCPPKHEDIDKIRNYFGEQIAF